MAGPISLTALAVLAYIEENGIGEGWVIPHDIIPEADQEHAYAELRTLGLTDDTMTLDGGVSFLLTETGRVRARGAQRGYLRQKLQHDILTTVDQGSPVVPDDFVSDDPNRSYEKVVRAIDHLADNGLITGTRASGGALLLGSLTNLGEAALDSGYGPEDFLATRGASLSATYDNSVHITDSPSAAVSTGSGNATSTGNTVVTLAVGQVAPIDALKGRLATLDVQDPEAASEFTSRAHSLREAVSNNSAEISKGILASLIATAFIAWGPAVLSILADFSRAIGF